MLIKRISNVGQRLRRLEVERERRRYVGDVVTIADMKRDNKEFMRLHDYICSVGTDSMAHLGYCYTHEGGMALQQHPDEFASLALFLRERRPFTNYLEIGSASGGACLILWEQTGFENAFSIDDGRHPRAPLQKQHLGKIPGLKQFVGDSHSLGAKHFIQENVKGKLDVAFIDGDHSYEGAWQDVQLVLPFCRPGTLLLLHDTIACDTVEKVWLKCVREGLVKPLAEFIGAAKPLGIAVGSVI